METRNPKDFQVIVGVHAVMANGGVIGSVGLNMVALAAKKHAVPFVIVAGCHKVYKLLDLISRSVRGFAVLLMNGLLIFCIERLIMATTACLSNSCVHCIHTIRRLC